MVGYLEERARRQPDVKAYTFLRDGDTEAASLSFTELDRRARAVASRLLRDHRTGERALLLYPPGIEFPVAFFGCLYAGVIAVPVPTPRSSRRSDRLVAVIRDAGPALALTDLETSKHLQRLAGQIPELAALELLVTDAPDMISVAADDGEPPASHIEPKDLAYLQYTSGSTGTPKGVMVTHENLLRGSMALDEAWRHDTESVLVSWLPTFHDMGLVYGIVQPVYGGFPGVLMSPASFLQRPIRWLEAISRYEATHSVAPNFAYELCVRKTTPEQRRRLDLSPWRAAVNGAEPIRAATLERFAEAFTVSGFRAEASCPGYGLAEATLGVTATHTGRPPVFRRVRTDALTEDSFVSATVDEMSAQTFVGCGPALLDTRIAIVDPHTFEPCKPNRIGEIWVSGSIVAKGYWQRHEESLQTFGAYLAESGDGPFLRTGDLGLVTAGGQLFVTGRLKDLIVIRGRNHYPQDIERTVQASHEALEPDAGAAFSVEVDGEERLVVVQEVCRSRRRDLDADAVIDAVREAVFEGHELMIHDLQLLRPSSVPKTSSGKVRRRECRGRYLAGELPKIAESRKPGRKDPVIRTEAAPEESTAAQLRKLAAAALEVEPTAIDVDKRLSHLGFDSLRTFAFLDAVKSQLGRELPRDLLFTNPSLAELVEVLNEGSGKRMVDTGSLVPIRPDGSRPPMFFAHPLGGIVYPYYELARRLAPEQPSYGLQAAGFYSSQADTTVEEMAERYIAAMRVVQPSGPYLIAGWSFGAFVAYELARQLAKAGEEIALLAILDMPMLARHRASLASRTRFYGWEFPRTVWPVVFDYFRLVAGSGRMHPELAEARFERSRRRLYPTVARELGALLRSRDSTLRRAGLVMWKNWLAMGRYRPRAYPGPATLFRTHPPFVPERDDPTLGWSRLALTGVDIEPISGKHMNFLALPHVEPLAALLDRHIVDALDGTRRLRA